MEGRQAAATTVAATAAEVDKDKEVRDAYNSMPITVEYVDVDTDTWQVLMDDVNRVIVRAQKTYENADHGSGHRASLCSRVTKDDNSVYRWTGFDMRAFSLIWSSFAEQWVHMERAEIKRKAERAAERNGKRGPRPRADIIADRINNMPLLRDDPERGGLPGNRCKLEPVHVLLLALIRKYQDPGEGMLGDLFDIDQSTVSRYLDLADRVLEDILPTPKKIMQIVMDAATPQDFASLFPEGAGDIIVIIDGTHVRFARPVKKEKRDPMISRKKNYPSGNTLVMVSKDGLILGISKTHNGRVHDMELMRGFLSEMGRFGEMLQGKGDKDGKPQDVSKVEKEKEQQPAKTPLPAAEEKTAISLEDTIAPAAHPAAATANLPEPANEMLQADAPEKTKPGKTLAPSLSQSSLQPSPEEIEIKIASGLAALVSTKKVIQKKAAREAAKRIQTMHALARLNNAASDVMMVLGDKGFQGFQNDMPGADAHHPFKIPRKGNPTPEQKAYNSALNKKRIKVEHAIGSAKHFKRVSGIYSGSLDKFNREFNIASGLANLRHMLRNGTYNDWAKKLGLSTLDRGR